MFCFGFFRKFNRKYYSMSLAIKRLSLFCLFTPIMSMNVHMSRNLFDSFLFVLNWINYISSCSFYVTNWIFFMSWRFHWWDISLLCRAYRQQKKISHLQNGNKWLINLNGDTLWSLAIHFIRSIRCNCYSSSSFLLAQLI